jgi:diguanylate cyclase (GGDEF)-like protein/PAS domain S-box-containing protein
VTSRRLLQQGERALADYGDGGLAARRSANPIETLTTGIVDMLAAASASAAAALPELLTKLAQLVPIDRVIVAGNAAGADPDLATPLLRWSSPQLPSGLLTETPFEQGAGDAAFQQWIEPLARGIAVAATRASASETMRSFLERGRLGGLLIAPIMLGDRHWGMIGFESCRVEPVWSEQELGILRLAAATIAAAVARDQQSRALTAAHRVIQHSPTILFRLAAEPRLPLRHIAGNLSLLGHDADELLRVPLRYHEFIHEADREAVQAEMAQLLAPGAKSSTMEFRWLTRDGSVRWLENHCSAVRDGAGVLVEIEGLITDITERKRAQEQIALLARTDALTGVANRMIFTERLRQAFAASLRGAHPFAVLYLDLDRFKEVNDSLGHHAGDLLLQQVAHRIQAATRQIDLVARLGGDEFAIVQGELIESASAGTLADKLIEIISAPYVIDGSELRVGASIGIALYSADAHSPDLLLAQADQALYRAKLAGRGRYRFYSEQIDRETRAHLALAEDLRSALARRELQVYYQPQVELATGRIVGMEALLRWNHPTRGVILPEDFLPIAEKFGIMQQVGRWVLNEACTQMAAWRAQRMPVPVVAINVALAQIRMGSEFVRDVMESITRARLEACDVELDVTEGVLARATLAQSSVLEELRRLGVGIAIDDFGAQYSSLDYLRTYRINRLKIARGMIAAADAEPGGGAMIRAILSLARELDVEVVAEGVETEAQRQLLIEASAQAQGQGFYYSRAVSADESMALLREGRMAPAGQGHSEA